MNELNLENHQLEIPRVILLDVYETMLDMDDVERRVNHLTDSKRGYMVWFELFMQYCFVENCTARFNNFGSIAKATLQMTGKMLGRNITDDQADGVLEILKHLPVHDGVQKGLSRLRDMGFRIAALTNSPEKIMRERMEPTGLISFFELVLSAETIKKYKPCTDVYLWAASSLGEDIQHILLVSAHGWDIAGGGNAGMQTAYLRQPKQMLYPLAPSPNYICNNLDDLANQLEKIRVGTPVP
jgi:2-haloacid dehalogenase